MGYRIRSDFSGWSRACFTLSGLMAALVVACQPARPAVRLDSITSLKLSQLGGTNPESMFPQRNPEIRFKQLGGQVTIFVPGRSSAHILNETGSRVFILIDGRHSISDLAEALVDEFEVDYPTALKDTIDLLADLQEKGVLTRSMSGSTRA